MNERTIRRYLGQILSGLAQLHNDGISHGFLNGETIYIDHCGLLKLGVRPINYRIVLYLIKLGIWCRMGHCSFGEW